MLAPPIFRAFPGFDDVVQGFERFLNRRVRIESMNLIEVDVIGLQPPQRIVDGAQDVRPREAALLRCSGDG